MRTRSPVVVAAVLALAACCPPREPGPSTTPPLDLAALLPALGDLGGWAVEGPPEEYAPETLYEVLDGGAERYLGHGFRRLLRVRYRPAGGDAAAVTLELFDMGDEAGAFGIYSAGRPPEGPVRRWGCEGWREGAVASAWRGRLFVHGEADDERPDLIDGLEQLMALVADRVPGGRPRPAVLDLLPAEGLVARSERLVAVDLLGHGFLPGGVLAAYEVEGRRDELFFSDLGGEAAAAEALAALHAHHQGSGVVTGDLPTAGEGGFRFQDPVLGAGAATRAGRFVAGAFGSLTAEERGRLLGRLAEGLRRSAEAG